MENRRKILELIQKNYSWVIATLTSLGILMTFVLKFIKYINSKIYFSYFDIAYELFDKNELNNLYDIYLSIILLSCLMSLLYCYIELFNIKDKKNKIKTIFSNVLLIMISNIFIATSINNDGLLKYSIISVIILIVSELIVAFILNKNIKKESKKTNQNNNLLDSLKLAPFYILICLILITINPLLNFAEKKTYRIIENNKVIVYSTKEYSIILNCDIDAEKNKLVIYTGEQTIIDAKKVLSINKKFDEVEMK